MASELSLKLLIDTKSNMVLFAEAGKDVVDLLFSLLSIPVGTITKLLTNEQMVGSIGSIYKSIQNMDQTYFQSDQNKNILLNPTTRSPSSNWTLFLTGAGSVSAKYYRCAYTTGSFESNMCTLRITDVYGTRCPSCGKPMNVEMHFVDPNSEEARVEPCSAKRMLETTFGLGSTPGVAFGVASTPYFASTPPSQPLRVANNKAGAGFVKDVVTYTITDDLTVMPMSAISSITMLNTLNVRDVSSLEERTVKLGKQEGLALLKSSLQSNTVLTDVFIGRKDGKIETP